MIVPLRDQILGRIMATPEMMTLRGMATLQRDVKAFKFWDKRISDQLKKLKEAFKGYEP